MKIESIKVGKRDKSKLVIRLEDGTYVSARVEDAYKLKPGEELSEEAACELMRAYEAENVKKSAAKSLAHHSMSRYDLSRKLKNRGFSEEESEDAVGWFEEKGLIDDESYAHSVVEYYKNRGYGVMRIREELRRHGISREISEELLENLGSGETELQRLIEKKTHGNPITADEKRKLVAFLSRRGFRFDEIRTAMQTLQLDTEDMI